MPMAAAAAASSAYGDRLIHAYGCCYGYGDAYGYGFGNAYCYGFGNAYCCGYGYGFAYLSGFCLSSSSVPSQLAPSRLSIFGLSLRHAPPPICLLLSLLYLVYSLDTGKEDLPLSAQLRPSGL